MAKLYEQEEGNTSVNVISAGTMITGDVVCSGDLRIDGNIKGNVKSRAKVIIGQSGIIDGDINCKSIEIEGNVKANVTVTDLMALKSTANLVGNICAGKLAIEPGANFAGNCKMQGMKAEVHPAAPATENKAQ
jgi:cytoskeletal protein CcmA (bactofilin family)